MAGFVNTRTSTQLQTKVLEASFYNEIKAGVPPVYQSIVNVITPPAKRSVFTALPLAGLGTTEFKGEGQAPAYDQPYELIPISATFFTYALAVKATEEAQDDDIGNLVSEVPQQLARSSRVSKDLVINQIFNLAFNGNVIYNDGQPLISTLHPLGPISTPTGIVASAGTFSNSLGPTALTPEALQQAYILFATLLNDRGLPDQRTPRTLMVPVPMVKLAQEIVGSAKAPFTADNQINVLEGTVQVFGNRYLTNNNAWFVLGNQGDPFKGGDNHQLFAAFKKISAYKAWRDDETGNYNQKVSDRYTFGAAGWRGLVGSQGSAGNV
jgi:hypothetical protein